MNTNLLYGSIPLNLGSLKHLKIISVAENQLTGEPGVPQLRFLSSLFNCSSLESLVVTYNPKWNYARSLGNISYSSLSDFYAEGCQIKGPMPTTLDSLTTLTLLSLDHNNISGNLPPSLGGMRSLQRLFLHNNSIEGHIPYELCHTRNLGELSLGNNKISGLIPDCIGNLNHLQILLLNSNNLTSSIPGKIYLGTKSVGTFQATLELFQSLNYFNMSNNMLWDIPQTFGDLKGLEFLDLSYNNLSGAIPKYLETLKYLKYINLSFNQLSGEIPSEGPFVNFTPQSFLENRALCGKQNLEFHLARLVEHKNQRGFIYRKGNASIISGSAEELLGTKHRMISYHELRCATNDFCESNLLGEGSFGSVYKGILSDGTIVAVKVLNMQMEGASKSFDAECNVWRAIRHRNLVKVITSCSSPEVRALVLQYMSNGSLEKCLAISFWMMRWSHVGDFGLAKILANNKDATQTRTLGTLGYISPEYGHAGIVSTRGDVYSFGIMLLELIVRKKPTDEMFAEELSLRQWINASLADSVLEVVDIGLLKTEEGRDMNATEDIIFTIMEIGLRCSEDVPEKRMDIKDVVSQLMKIKLGLESRN
ncbi:putative LRR receptor-like serine/threonine-protein kinase [Prunus yedoensis var. nudiflora]|uniref:Putative LRR receptor-like serine/threonine-protein kinase n=1 Tax=Prunus yedoensis var. nudiflora TaxID=2094558 RepID=A0A314Y5G8_PRUYE|nr:putative LRR receptor-like serine/threonine-protein kinase [Prunus yedoensis var. nudiflora]